MTREATDHPSPPFRIREANDPFLDTGMGSFSV